MWSLQFPLLIDGYQLREPLFEESQHPPVSKFSGFPIVKLRARSLALLINQLLKFEINY